MPDNAPNRPTRSERRARPRRNPPDVDVKVDLPNFEAFATESAMTETRTPEPDGESTIERTVGSAVEPSPTQPVDDERFSPQFSEALELSANAEKFGTTGVPPATSHSMTTSDRGRVIDYTDNSEKSSEKASSQLPVSPLESVLRRPFVFGIAAAIGLLLSAFVTLTQPKTYYAQTTVTVISAGVNGESVPLDNAGAASTAFAFSRYGFSTASANGITKRTRLTVTQAFPRLKFDSAPNSPFITIRAAGSSPGAAFRLADAASESLKDIVTKFRTSAEQRLKDQQSSYEAARSNTLAAETDQLELQTKLTSLQNDLLFDPNSSSIAAKVEETRAALRTATIAAESNRAKADAQLTALSDAQTQIENGLQLRTFTETFLAGSDGGVTPNAQTLLIFIAGCLLGVALTTMLENRSQFRNLR